MLPPADDPRSLCHPPRLMPETGRLRPLGLLVTRDIRYNVLLAIIVLIVTVLGISGAVDAAHRHAETTGWHPASTGSRLVAAYSLNPFEALRLSFRWPTEPQRLPVRYALQAA